MTFTGREAKFGNFFPQMKKCINLGSWTGVGLLIVQIEMNGPNEGFFQLEKDAFFSQQFRP